MKYSRTLSSLAQRLLAFSLRPNPALVLVYASLVGWLLFLYPGGYFSHVNRMEVQRADLQVHLIPFSTISYYVHSLVAPPHPSYVREACINLAGNVLLFVPMGTMVSHYVSPRISPAGIIAICIAISLSLETMQYTFGVGNFDIDDIILNTMGCMLGSCFHRQFSASHPTLHIP